MLLLVVLLYTGGCSQPSVDYNMAAAEGLLQGVEGGAGRCGL